MRIFNLGNDLQAICETKNTRNGFKHEATLLFKGGETTFKAKCNYINRTWERYQYQSVLKRLKEQVEKSGFLMFNFEVKEHEYDYINN